MCFLGVKVNFSAAYHSDHKGAHPVCYQEAKRSAAKARSVSKFVILEQANSISLILGFLLFNLEGPKVYYLDTGSVNLWCTTS